ncbi:hypothetical protein [Kineococcus arenarius]|uniref:hypothetical protein n=1 Tax=unclassified Kineococcus TaxID=2621656 RepID=UPI003D7C737D
MKEVAVVAWALAAAVFACCSASALIRRAGDRRIPVWVGRQPPRSRGWFWCTVGWMACFQFAARAAHDSGVSWWQLTLLGLVTVVLPGVVLIARHNRRCRTGQDGG